MNARSLLITLYKFFPNAGKIAASKYFTILSATILVFSYSVPAQKSIWRYVTTVQGGTKGYLNSEIKSLANGNKTAWEKIVMTDGSFAIALVEWNCRNKLRLPKQISFYNADQTIIGTKKKQFEWSEIIPGSASDFIFTRICSPPQTVKIAEIITLRANLRVFPDISAPIAREAEQGERFEIAPESGESGWYNIVNPATQEDFWLHGNTIKILDESSIQEKPKKTITLSETVDQNRKTKSIKKRKN